MERHPEWRRHRLGLRAGEWVTVRSRREILATLDDRGCYENLPFQPEMLAFCGRRMRVAKSAHKTCDNIRKTGGRRMLDAVHLEAARCDGAEHGGCQADCVFFWKEAWLKRADAAGAEDVPAGGGCTEAAVHAATTTADSVDDDPTWVCQTTALYDATLPLAWWDVRQYIRDVTSGNHSAGHMLGLLAAAAYRKFVAFGPGFSAKVALYNWIQRRRGGAPFPHVKARIPRGERTPTRILDLEPGEWVTVRPVAEIERTLTADGMNRGMRYDKEMAQYSGQRYRVEMRVDRLVNEVTGKMMHMKNPCIQLEGVHCRATCTPGRLGCPRASNTYWREIWLRREEGAGSGAVPEGTRATGAEQALVPR